MDSRNSSTESSTKNIEPETPHSFFNNPIKSFFNNPITSFFERMKLQKQCDQEVMKARLDYIKNIEQMYDKPIPWEKDFEVCRRLKPSPQS